MLNEPEYLDQPSQRQWNNRRDWFEGLLSQYEEQGGPPTSEQAVALMAEVERCFCAGAFISVVILAFTVIDAQIRDIDAPDFKGNSKQLFEAMGFDERFQQLRQYRNRFIHTRSDNPAITIDQYWYDQEQREREAREAIGLMFEAFFDNPCV